MIPNIILFGPPGVGKSTLISILKSGCARAVDLEDIYPSKLRFKLPNEVQGCILGAADLNPKRNYPHSLKVLLYCDQDMYDLRRTKRDANDHAKAAQARHEMMSWLSGVRYDLILDTTHLSPLRTARKIGEFAKSKGLL